MDDAKLVSVAMQDLVGDYDVPGDVPAWDWVREHASFAHVGNGKSGVWEFVLNLSCDLGDVPGVFVDVLAEARSRGASYLLVHQNT